MLVLKLSNILLFRKKAALQVCFLVRDNCVHESRSPLRPSRTFSSNILPMVLRQIYIVAGVLPCTIIEKREAFLKK